MLSVAHGIGLKQLLHELGFDVGKVIVYEDNQAAQQVAKE
jgi:hypothetical protein